MTLLPVDLTEIIRAELATHEWDDDLLHASSHLIAPLRHVQLELAGAPQLGRSFGSQMTLLIGRLMHDWIESTLRNRGLPFMGNVNVTPWLPKGWGGTADIVMWNPEHQGFVLVDEKSTKGESIRWRVARGPSDEHVWQTSVYWHALKKMGLPMLRKIGVFYIPKNETRGGDDVEPLLVEFEPIGLRTLQARMAKRRKAVEAYRASLPKPNPRPLELEEFVTDKLAPVQERVQKIVTRNGVQTLLLAPHWTAEFCPFPNELCDCRTQGETKLGAFDDDGDYWPRKGYEDIEPEIWPEEEDD